MDVYASLGIDPTGIIRIRGLRCKNIKKKKKCVKILKRNMV